MRIQTGRIFLPAAARFSFAAIAGGPRVLRRVECSADGRVYLVEIRPAPRGVRLRVTGVNAAQAEVLAPIAARVRRALGLDGAPLPRLRRTTPFEDAALALVATAPDRGAGARFLRLGRPCPAAPRLRIFPAPGDVVAQGSAKLGRLVGSAALGRRLHALARAFEIVTPCEPTRS